MQKCKTLKKRYHKQAWMLVVLLLSLLAGCARHTEGPGGMGNIDELSSLAPAVHHHGHKHIGNVRRLAIQETAMSVGAQSALAQRATVINHELSLHTKKLDHIFDFNALMLDHNVLPPVLQQGDNALNLASGDAIRVSDRVYRILKQAHFVTTVPHWRNYLWMNFNIPERPHESVLPHNREEREVWAQYVALGWKRGADQAKLIFEENLAHLTEDFQGMILYRKLLANHMVSPPYVAKTSLGVTGDSHEIHINDQVLRITALPGLLPDSKHWRANVSKKHANQQTLINWKLLAKENTIVHHHPHPLAHLQAINGSH